MVKSPLAMRGLRVRFPAGATQQIFCFWSPRNPPGHFFSCLHSFLKFDISHLKFFLSEMSSACSSDWEALPPREKKKNGETLNSQEPSTSNVASPVGWDALPPREKRIKDSCFGSEETQTTVSSAPAPAVGRTKVAKHQQILDNIEARKQITHNISTLQSKDGCAGQFYECTKQYYNCYFDSHHYSVNINLHTDLDHTADVQCHAWGATMKEAFQNMAPCMMNYMTDLTLVNIDPDESTNITIEGTVTLQHSWPPCLLISGT